MNFLRTSLDTLDSLKIDLFVDKCITKAEGVSPEKNLEEHIVGAMESKVYAGYLLNYLNYKIKNRGYQVVVRPPGFYCLREVIMTVLYCKDLIEEELTFCLNSATFLNFFQFF